MGKSMVSCKFSLKPIHWNHPSNFHIDARSGAGRFFFWELAKKSASSCQFCEGYILKHVLWIRGWKKKMKGKATQMLPSGHLIAITCGKGKSTIDRWISHSNTYEPTYIERADIVLFTGLPQDFQAKAPSVCQLCGGWCGGHSRGVAEQSHRMMAEFLWIPEVTRPGNRRKSHGKWVICWFTHITWYIFPMYINVFIPEGIRN